MTSSEKPGVVLVASSPTSTIALGRLADQNGVSSLWVPEFYDRSALGIASALAAVTREAKIGTAVAWGLARAPLVLANEAREIASLSGGRFLLGIGSGSRAALQRWMGQSDQQAVARLAEVVQVLKLAAASTGDLAFDGVHYQIDVRSLASVWEPFELPVLVGGVSSRMVAMAGAISDGLLVHPFSTDEFVQRVLTPEVGNAAVVNRRKTPTIWRLQLCSVAENRRDAYVAAATHIAFECVGEAAQRVVAYHSWRDVVTQIRELARQRDYAGMVRYLPQELVSAVAWIETPESLATRLVSSAVQDSLILYPPTYVDRRLIDAAMVVLINAIGAR